MKYGRVTVFGGSGFLGRHIVKRLAAEGAVVRVAVRDPEGALFLKPMGAVGQIVPAYADVRDEATVEAAVAGADAVINAVSLYTQSRRLKFADVHVRGAARVAEKARAAGAKRLVHISGIGATKTSVSTYARARAHGDAAVRDAFPDAAVLCPSVIFGPDDHFFNTLAAFARLSMVMPLFGRGATKLQIVYAGDVAEAAVAVLSDAAAKGAVYELGGPRVYTYREVVKLLLEEIGRRRILVPVPFAIASAMAMLMGVLPSPPITRDMIKLLKTDNVVGAKAKGFKDLGIRPTAAEAILPTYLDRFRRGGRWSQPRLA